MRLSIAYSRRVSQHFLWVLSTLFYSCEPYVSFEDLYGKWNCTTEDVNVGIYEFLPGGIFKYKNIPDDGQYVGKYTVDGDHSRIDISFDKSETTYSYPFISKISFEVSGDAGAYCNKNGNH